MKQRREMVRMIRGNFIEYVTFQYRPIKRLWNKPHDIWEKSVSYRRNKYKDLKTGVFLVVLKNNKEADVSGAE